MQYILSHIIDQILDERKYKYEDIGHLSHNYYNRSSKEIFYMKESVYFIYDISQLSSYAMLSKQFFKVFSNIFGRQLLKENYFYKWIALKVPGYINSDYSGSDSYSYYKDSGAQDSNRRDIIQESFKYINQRNPLVFNYETIKSIPYDISKEKLELIFSKIETFFIASDEYDINERSDNYLTRDFKSWCSSDGDAYTFFFNDDVDIKYKKSICSSNYLVMPPPMPSLKNIIVSGYYGYKDNYNNFLISLFSNCQRINNYKSSISKIENNQKFKQKQYKFKCNNCNGNGGIEFFSFDLHVDFALGHVLEANFSFFKDLLLHNSKSIKRIDVTQKRYDFDECI